MFLGTGCVDIWLSLDELYWSKLVEFTIKLLRLWVDFFFIEGFVHNAEGISLLDHLSLSREGSLETSWLRVEFVIILPFFLQLMFLVDSCSKGTEK